MNVAQLKEAGFNENEIDEYVVNKRISLMKAGFSTDEINKHFGISFDDKPLKAEVDTIIRQGKEPSIFERFLRAFEPDIKSKAARSQISLMAAEETGIKPHEFEPTLSEAVKSGFEQSITGMLYKGKAPKMMTPEQEKLMPQTARILNQATALAGDLPYMIAGGLLTAESGPATAMAGAFALPAGIRKALIDKYEKGEVRSFKEFWERLTGALFETGKGYATGLATGSVGVSMGPGLKVPAEIATMVILQNALEGQVPEPNDFMDAAILIGGMHMATMVSGRLKTIYKETGRTPKEVLQDIQEDPEIRREILGTEEKIPESYVVEEKPTVEKPISKKPVEEENFYRGPVKPWLAERIRKQLEKEGHEVRLEQFEEGQDKYVNIYVKYKGISEKEPWQMTSQEFTESGLVKPWTKKRKGGDYYATITGYSKYGYGNTPAEAKADFFKVEHEYRVQEALKKGEKVSDEVLAEYPKLQKQSSLEEQKILKAKPIPKAEETLLEEVNKIIEQERGTERGSLSLEEPGGPESTFRFTDPEIESRFKSAQRIRKDPFLDRAYNSLVDIKNKIVREYEYLPKTEEFAQARFDLLKLSKQKGVAAEKTLQKIRGITIGLNKADFDLFTRKVVLDDLLETSKEGKALPFGFTPETLKQELSLLDQTVEGNVKVNEAIQKRNALWNELKAEYINIMKDIGFDVSKRLTRKNYFRHQVLDYISMKGLFGTGQRLRTPAGRGFLKARKGSELDISSNYIQTEHEIMSQMLYDIEVAKVIKDIDKQYNIADILKNQAKKEAIKDWKELIPDTHTPWQPREGNIFYMTDSIPAKLAEQLTSGALEELGVTAQDIRKALALGGRRREFIIPNELAETLDNLTVEKSKNTFSEWQKKGLRGWKIWQLVSPRRWFKYNTRNMTGDADGTFAGNPASFLKVPQAIQDLWEVYVGKKAMTGDLKDWFERGGMQATLQANEMGELNQLKMFAHLQAQPTALTKIPIKIWQTYWKTARLSTDFRESILRYASYLSYLEQMKKDPNGRPKNFGASIPEEIMGLKDIKDRAYWLSNDLLGAYDRVGLLGQNLREHLYPFWSWKEVNFRRYIRLFKNAAADDRFCEVAGRKALGTLATTSFKAIRIGKFLVKAAAFWSALQVWNNFFFKDEEDDLPEEVRGRPHIILGRDDRGEVLSFNRIGALGDLLEWFGLDIAPKYVDNWFKGKMTLKEIALDMAKQPPNILIQGAEPFGKMTYEMIARQALYPDAFKPRVIRDRMLHALRSIGLENEYLALSGKPGKPYPESVVAFFMYKTDPLQAAYSDIMNDKHHFLKKQGKGAEGFWITPKGNALYNSRLALRYGDKEAFTKYMKEYLTMGGTFEGLSQSLNRMDPLADLSKPDKAMFLASLNKEDRYKLTMAYMYWAELVSGTDMSPKFMAKRANLKKE